jgi:hypothetical protein
MTRTYYDVSHFRAPYKNWAYLSGFGATGGTPGAPLAPQVQAMVDVDPDGTLVLKPAIQKTVSDFLQTRVVLVIGNDLNVSLQPSAGTGDVRENAWAWFNRQLGAGRTVLAGSTAGVAGLGMPTEAVQKLLMAVGTPAEARVATTGGLYAVLARPASAGKPAAGPGLFAKLGGVGTAVVVLAGAGLAYLLLFKKKHARA